MIELPHTSNCLVCGQGNPHGLRLSLFVEPTDGAVSTRLVPTGDHIGFEGIVHGGLLATVLDEVMVWAATWAGRRFCVCGELAVRFKESARVGEEIVATARVEVVRSKLITTTGEVRRVDGTLLATATGKYVPVKLERHQQFMKTLVYDVNTAQVEQRLRMREMKLD